MQIICYLIICPDIVNTIGFCWSLVAERKEKILISGTRRLQDRGGGAEKDKNEEEQPKQSGSREAQLCAQMVGPGLFHRLS